MIRHTHSRLGLIVGLEFILFALVAASASFPETLFRSKQTIQVMDPTQNPEAARYLRYLSAMQESSLLKSNHPEVYQLLFLPSFSAPYLYRLTIEPEGSGILITKTTNGDDSKPGSLCFRQHKRLSKKDVDDLRNVFGQAKFWDLTPIEEPLIIDHITTIIEARQAGLYHAIEFWPSPETAPALAAWVTNLISLSSKGLCAKQIQDRITPEPP